MDVLLILKFHSDTLLVRAGTAYITTLNWIETDKFTILIYKSLFAAPSPLFHLFLIFLLLVLPSSYRCYSWKWSNLLKTFGHKTYWNPHPEPYCVCVDCNMIKIYLFYLVIVNIPTFLYPTQLTWISNHFFYKK